MNITAPKLQRDDLTTKLIASFKDLIARRVLKPGAKLPPERDLAQRFGVSRSSLRHALKSLDTLGIITQRVGDGTYLTSDPSHILVAPLEFLLLMEGISELDVADTRLIVEPELAARAAAQASEELIARLGELMEGLRTETDSTKLIELDIAFHEAIFSESGNRLISRIFSMLHRLVYNNMEITSQHVDSAHTLQFHEPIYRAICDRNPTEARNCMIAHLTDSRQILQQAAGRVRNTGGSDEYPMLTKRAAEKAESREITG